MINDRVAVFNAFKKVVIAAIDNNVESIECLTATNELFSVLEADIGQQITPEQRVAIQQWYPPIAAELSCIVNAEHRALIEERYIRVIEGALNG